jgi:hypothetical protein
MSTEDYIINMPDFLKAWMIQKTQEELDNLYNSRNLTADASYFPVSTSDFMTSEGRQWFKDKGLELREESWLLGSIPNKSMTKHTDFSPCCFIYNLEGSYNIYWLTDEGIIDPGQYFTMDYPFQPGGEIIKRSKYINIKYKDNENLPVIVKSHSGTNEFTLIETSTIHYAVSGPERFMFWSPRPLDITLDYAEVKKRVFS